MWLITLANKSTEILLGQAITTIDKTEQYCTGNWPSSKVTVENFFTSKKQNLYLLLYGIIVESETKYLGIKRGLKTV